MKKTKAQGSKTTLPGPQALPLPLASTMSSVRHSRKKLHQGLLTQSCISKEKCDLYAGKCLATSWGGGGGREGSGEEALICRVVDFYFEIIVACALSCFSQV